MDQVLNQNSQCVITCEQGEAKYYAQRQLHVCFLSSFDLIAFFEQIDAPLKLFAVKVRGFLVRLLWSGLLLGQIVNRVVIATIWLSSSSW